MPHTPEHKLSADDLLGLGEDGGIGILEALLLGQRFQAIRLEDGSLRAFDRTKGEFVSGELAPAAPAKPDIKWFQDPNTGTFFILDESELAEDGSLILEVISEKTPEIQQGFQHILEAALAISEAGLNPLKYNFVFADGKVVPTLIDQIPQTQDSFSTAVDASGQLLAVSRLTGNAVPIGATPKAADVPPDATVELDPITKQFKVTQPNGQISFLQAPVDIKLPQEVTIGGQSFAFNPNTGGFQQVQVPARRFDPGVVVEGGRSFIQGPSGELTPLGREEVPNLDELINERILSGDAPGALALADFQDRPTSLEAFNAAMQFAQSPGDVAAISAISRGQSLVAPPPSGTVQRIAEQPEFLQDAFQRLINQFRGGTGSPDQFIDVLTRINKERDERQTALDARDKELVTEKEKNQQLEREKALEPFRKMISDLQSQLDALGGVGGRATPTTVQSSPSFQETFGAANPRAIFDPVTQSFTQDTDDIGGGGGTGVEARTQETQADRDQAFAAFNADLETATSGAADIGLDISGVDLTSATSIEAALAEQGLDPFAKGGTTHHSGHMEIVGEPGPDGKPNPELVELPPGTRVTPISNLSAAQLKALKKMGVRGMQTGGIVDPLLPFGVRRALAGGIIEPTRRRLSRAAGLPVLSAQARQNLLPEELEVFNRLSREAGIPEGAFRQEQESAFPGANLARGRARFAPRVLR